MSKQRVIVAGWIIVDPKRRDDVVASFEHLVARARKAPGCLDFVMGADPVDAARINLFEFWQSQKDLNAWRRVARSPKPVTRVLRTEVQKHIIQKSGSPF
jgi:quinol monooxygenase YgiN